MYLSETNDCLGYSKGFLDEKTAEKMRKEEEKIREMAKAMEKEEHQQAKAAKSGDTKQSVASLACLCCITHTSAAASLIRLPSSGRPNMHRQR